MYLGTGYSEPIIRQWIHTKNKYKSWKKLKYQKFNFFKQVEMFCHPVDR